MKSNTQLHTQAVRVKRKKSISFSGKSGSLAVLVPEPVWSRLMQMRLDNRDNNDRVFMPQSKSLLSKLKRALRSICQKVGIPPVNFHSFRVSLLANRSDQNNGITYLCSINQPTHLSAKRLLRQAGSSGKWVVGHTSLANSALKTVCRELNGPHC